MATLSKLLRHGVIGTYTHFESTEIFATLQRNGQVINVFTILVAEERSGETSTEPEYVNNQRITLESLPGWTFGIKRYLRPLADLAPTVDALVTSGELRASGEVLRVGKLHAVSAQFVQPDSSGPVPWNRVLKNNFWNGSYVLEWADKEKKTLQPFFDDPRRLQELSRKVGEYLPISLAGLSDRLGNVVVQLPVTAIMCKFEHLWQSGDFVINLAWHSSVTPRELRATCEMEFDGIIDSYASGPVQVPQAILPGQPSFGALRGYVWDDANQVILAATGPTNFIHTIGINITPVDHEPRTWIALGRDGLPREHRVAVFTSVKNIIGEEYTDDNGGYTRRRLYQEDLDRLTAERKFIQYRPATSDPNSEHEKALNDLRLLINKYGDEGAWLWDPYISADDVLKTLFYCSHAGADLRALTAAREPPSPSGLCARIEKWVSTMLHGHKPDFVERQRITFDAIKSNWRGLRLEYRVRRGPAGFGFHDRFLIFPRRNEAALAWSLGTSVNSLGKEHHILQKVDDGQLVANAFRDLWDQLTMPEHLVWKKP